MTDDPRVEDLLAMLRAERSRHPFGEMRDREVILLILAALDTARPTRSRQAVEAALESCVQLALEYRDEAGNGKHPDASDPAHSLGQGYAANVIALRIRALAAAHATEEPTPPGAPDENALPADALWKAIRMVGAREDERRDFLIEMLNCESGGCRSAAASALGEMGEIGALRDRLPVETNKFVIAGITAQLRVDTVHLTQSQQRTMEHAVRRTFRVLDDPNSLPMDMLPEGAWLDHIWSSQDREKHERYYHCIVQIQQAAPPGFPQTMKSYHETGPTPRAAFVAACEKVREG